VENQFNPNQKPQNSSALNVVKSKSKDVEDAESLVVFISVRNVVFQGHNGEN